MGQLMNRTRNLVLANQVHVADTLWLRAKGLLGTKSLSNNQTLWIRDCRSVHTCFMKYAIDVVFVDQKLLVKRVIRNLRPWRMSPLVWDASSCFEFSAGALDAVEIGDQLDVGH